MRSVERMRTISAQARVAVVRNTPKPCIDAINAINPLRADAIFFDAACWMIASPLNGQTPK